MSVKKSVLKQKPNRELEKYLLPENTFVAEAVVLAVEILEERGRTFSGEEILRIKRMIALKEKEELEPKEKIVEPNPKKESENNIIFIVLILIYCTYGIVVDDLFIPRRHGSGGIHLHGTYAWCFYGGIACVVATFILNHIKNFHQKKNEKTLNISIKILNIGAILLVLLAIFFRPD